MPATISTSGEVTRINLSGEFDFSNQENLIGVFKQALDSAASQIQIDMQNTTFIDSSVIRILLKLHEMARKNKKNLSLANCNERLREIFAIGGFDRIFDIQ